MTRTITDPSELDVLPPWAVVEDVLGVAWVKHPAMPGRADGWVSYYGDRAGSQHVALETPLTVLHDPSAPAAPSATREDVVAVLCEVMDDATYDDGTITHDAEKRAADALLARFTIALRTDR